MTTPEIVGIVIAVATTIGGAIGWLHMQRMNAHNTDMALLRSLVDELRKEVDALKRERAEMKAEIEEIKTENENLRRRVFELEAENSELRKRMGFKKAQRGDEW